MDPKRYKGNCHCAAFRFELTLPEEINTVTVCDCSICFKKDYLWLEPGAGEFKITRGVNALVGIEFRGEMHKFCPICGSGVMMEDKNAALRINARMLMDVNPFSLKISKYKKQPVHQTLPAFTGDLPTPNHEIENSKIYYGSCHCGAVTLAIETKPLPEVEIKEDNCSICQRNANTSIYPHTSQVSLLGLQNTTSYLFGRKFTGHNFCKTCGVSVFMRIHGPPKEVFDAWSEARREAVRGNFEILPVRVRVLEGVEWGELSVQRDDCGSGGYVVD